MGWHPRAAPACWRFAAGDVPFVLPSSSPIPLIAAVLVAMGAVAVITGGVTSGMAAGTGTLMVVFVILQGPAVECGDSSVSANSGPWWINEPNETVAYGEATADGRKNSGTIQVGESDYSYICEEDRLRSFERTENPAPRLEAPVPTSPVEDDR